MPTDLPEPVGARHQQVWHLGEVGHHRLTTDVLPSTTVSGECASQEP